ncbi:hypothetical protein IW262DRAFT_1294719 [Armillaria fumosa]|nr:hypothetical protein IW262DRAFT_1294719 [Armillaria fumosa]
MQIGCGASPQAAGSIVARHHRKMSRKISISSKGFRYIHAYLLHCRPGPASIVFASYHEDKVYPILWVQPRFNYSSGYTQSTYSGNLEMNQDEWFECYKDGIFPPKAMDEQATISSIPVPKQQSYAGRKPVIPSSLANTSCADLGVAVLLEKLNSTLGTSYTLETPSLSSLLETYRAKDYDFGTAYAHLRPVWYNGLTDVQDELHTCEVRDRAMRQNVLVNNKIIYNLVPPRRTWDLCSNRVVSWCITRQWPWAISHAWMEEKDRTDVLAPINGYQWPVPIPRDTDLDRIRIEMLNWGAEYVWLDVLCLRQKDGRREDLRAEEWKVDVPTIGAVYERAKKVVCYFSGLGRPLSLKPGDFESDRCWFRRAWTLQEISDDPIIGGDTVNATAMEEVVQAKFETDLESLRAMRRQALYHAFGRPSALSEMQKRVSTNPVDKVAGLAYLLRSDRIPAYYEARSEEDAWTALVDVIHEEFRAELFFRYPTPGDGNKRWRPSWKQVMTEVLPSYYMTIGFAEVYPPTDGTNWYGGLCIESGYVWGLAETPQEGKHRQGELLVEDKTGATHILNITADHGYPIPDGLYTLIGSDPRLVGPLVRLQYWVVGKRLSEWKLEKVSVFEMLEEEVVRLLDLDIPMMTVNILARGGPHDVCVARSSTCEILFEFCTLFNTYYQSSWISAVLNPSIVAMRSTLIGFVPPYHFHLPIAMVQEPFVRHRDDWLTTTSTIHIRSR